MMEEDEGLEIICPHCGRSVFIPAGYDRPMFLCPRCKKAIPLDAEVLKKLADMKKQ